MDTKLNNSGGDALPLENAKSTPILKEAVTPIGGAAPKKGLEPLSFSHNEPSIVGSDKIQTFESTSTLNKVEEMHFKRPINKDSQGATRVRTFHAKLNDGAFHFLDNQINEWIDSHPEVEVKFCNTTIGVVEAKKSEPHMIINIWY